MKITNYIMTFLFLLSAVIQFNDPDPLAWVVVYAVAAAVCVAFSLGRWHWAAAAATGLIAFLWACYLFPGMLSNMNDSSLADIFNFFNMKTPGTELIREIGGLLIIVVWMAVLTRTGYRVNKPA